MDKNSHFDGRPVQERTKTDLRHAPVDAVVEVRPGGKLLGAHLFQRQGSRRCPLWVSGRFLLSFQDLWERRGDEILDRVADEHPELVMMAQVKLAHVQRIEIGDRGHFSGLDKEGIVEKLEQRAGPKARRLFEKFIKDMRRLRDGNDDTQGDK